MKPTGAPTCAKCGATLPHVTDAAFRCNYCGAEYRAARQPTVGLDAEHVARLVAERLVAHQAAARPRRGFPWLAFIVLMLVLGGAGGAAYYFLAYDDGSGAALRLSGSNTIGADLAPALVEQFLRGRSAANVSRSSDGKRVTIQATLASETAPTAVSIDAAGTSTAFTALAAGRCDIAMASRPITAAERASLPGAKESVIGLDGIAVVVHPSTPVESLDTDQLTRIFRGDARSWSDVGAGGGPITVFARDANSGTWDTFRGLVLPTSALRSDAQRFDSNDQLVAAVARTPGAIGFTSLSAARGAKVLAVGEPGVTPIVPSTFTVATETYPLTRRLYLYTTKPNLLGDAFVNFAMSPDGQAVVARFGFVDLRPHAQEAPPAQSQECSGCTPEYKRATQGAQRMSIDFRFETGSTNLDSRGVHDVERVATWARSARVRKVSLLGFADSQGTPAVNMGISLDRARAVQKLLHDRGVDADAEGFGDSMPVASNSTPQGRDRNRRVEVWIAR
jgi:phosphate transport system substrate-binding protein